jgi:hypothetical protein
MTHEKHKRMNGEFSGSHWIPQTTVMLSLEGTCELGRLPQSGLVHKTSETIHKSHLASRLDELTQHIHSQPGSRSFCRRESLFVLLTDLLGAAVISQSSLPPYVLNVLCGPTLTPHAPSAVHSRTQNEIMTDRDYEKKRTPIAQTLYLRWYNSD